MTFNETSLHVCSNCTHHLTRHMMLPVSNEKYYQNIKKIPMICMVRDCECSDYVEVNA